MFWFMVRTESGAFYRLYPTGNGRYIVTREHGGDTPKAAVVDKAPSILTGHSLFFRTDEGVLWRSTPITKVDAFAV